LRALVWKEIKFYIDSVKSIRMIFVLGMFALSALLNVKIDILQITCYIIACASLFMYNVFLNEDYENLLSFKYSVKSIILLKTICLFIVSLVVNIIFLAFYYVYKGLSLDFLNFPLNAENLMILGSFLILTYVSLIFMAALLLLLGKKSSYFTLIPLEVVLISNFLHFSFMVNVLLTIVFIFISGLIIKNLTKEKVVIRSMSL